MIHTVNKPSIWTSSDDNGIATLPPFLVVTREAKYQRILPEKFKEKSILFSQFSNNHKKFYLKTFGIYFQGCIID